MKRGISLIVLVIIIIVIIILAGAIILNLSNNNPINTAKIAKLTQHKESLDSAMLLYLSNETTKTTGNYSTNEMINGLVPDIPKLIDTEDGINLNGTPVYLAKENVITEKLNISIENKENAKWYIDPNTGKFYLVYNDKQNYDTYLGNYNDISGTLQNKTLLQFVNAKNVSDYDEVKAVNKPRLISGMTPIKWDVNGNIVETTKEDSDWYDYTSKKWANARTADGSIWVWIPKYEYKIENPHTGNPQTIDIKFMRGTNLIGTNGYLTHPAFRFGDEDLSGIWVAKFEASGSKNSIDIKPNVTSLRNLSVGDVFTACRNMETNSKFGWGNDGVSIDTHLIKNVEWGAVAYLSNSNFGKNSKIWSNPNSSYLTGQAGTTENPENTVSTNEYNTSYGVNASTTGNVYGVYDMSGGALEYVSGYIDNNNVNLTQYAQSLLDADKKYKDLYSFNLQEDSRYYNYLSNTNKKGDAIYETSYNHQSEIGAWYNESSFMPHSYFPVFIRGGYANTNSYDGIFAFCDFSFGSPNNDIGFRPIVVISGL